MNVVHIFVHGLCSLAFWTHSSQRGGCPHSAFIYFHQYSMCITTFSLSLTLCCCSLKCFTVETIQKYSGGRLL